MSGPCPVCGAAAARWPLCEPCWSGFVAAEPRESLRGLVAVLTPIADVLCRFHADKLAVAYLNPAVLQTPTDQWPKVPFGNRSDAVEVARHWSAPEISGYLETAIGPATDVFHMALLAYAWVGRLLPEGILGDGLAAFDYQMPSLRVYRPDLPPGIAQVIAHGLDIDPSRRPTTPQAFLTELRTAITNVDQRWDGEVAIQWEVGGHTRAGRLKTAQKGDNQDYVLIQPFEASQSALFAVADGISCCDVGNGGLASRITCFVLENAFGPECSAVRFPEMIREACKRAGQYLIDWAVERHLRQHLIMGFDLMGTTLTAGWLEGRTLQLANLGDSRAYLIQGETIEQLTVDGDLGNELHDRRTPPEDVLGLAHLSKGLRQCIGGCIRTLDNDIAVDEERCTPNVSSWPLLPEDVVVLCSDGLVEEGVFLEPEEVAEIVNQYRDLTSEEIAHRLVDAADALQRLPTPESPDGAGDNISCIVIKVRRAEPQA